MKKTNPELVETVRLAKKNNLLELANKLAVPTRRQVKLSLTELNKILEKNPKEHTFIISGKVLGQGQIHRKISISALGFSEQAKEKLKKMGCEIRTIKHEIEKNPELKEVRII